MNKQEAYDQIHAHFSKPGAQIARERGTCVYRGEQDASSPTRCAFGCLIPDDLYTPDLEMTCADTLLLTVPRIRDHFDADNNTIIFIQRAQERHDKCHAAAEFLSDLNALALEHDLTLAA